MDDMTSVIPVIKSGIEYVNQAAASHSITVIVSALSEAASLVSNAHGAIDENARQSALREAEECATVALTYLSTILAPKDMSGGTRVHWRSGYTHYTGTVIQTMDDDTFMVVPDGAEIIYLQQSECMVSEV
jgi:hypothetical protein